MQSYPLPYSQRGPTSAIPQQHPRDVSIQILKFSYAVSSNERSSPLGWIHLASTGNLALSFHDTGLDDGCILRVSKGSEILVRSLPDTSAPFQPAQLFLTSRGCIQEDLNLSWLAQEAAHSNAQAHAPGKAPVAIIVRSPCLAVRYPTHYQQASGRYPSAAEIEPLNANCLML